MHDWTRDRLLFFFFFFPCKNCVCNYYLPMGRCSLFTPAARGVRWIHTVSSWGWILDLSQIHQILSPRNMESELNSTRAFFMYGWSWEDRTGSFWAAFFSLYIEREKERKPVSERGRRKNEQRGRDKGQRRNESLLDVPWWLSNSFFHALERTSCPMSPRYTSILTTNPPSSHPPLS